MSSWKIRSPRACAASPAFWCRKSTAFSIWASLIILIAISLYMMSESGAQYHQLRRVLGLPYFEGSQKKVVPGLPPAPIEEIHRAQADLRPMRPTAVGLGGILVILALMMFKPF